MNFHWDQIPKPNAEKEFRVQTSKTPTPKQTNFITKSTLLFHDKETIKECCSHTCREGVNKYRNIAQPNQIFGGLPKLPGKLQKITVTK